MSVVNDYELLLSTSYDLARRASYLALDVSTWAEATVLVDTFGAAVDGYKVGLQLYFGDGERALSELAARGKRVFLDVKFHDIPNTVAGALKSIGRFGVEMVNVHAFGGAGMLVAARQAVNELEQPPLLIGVTLLTSIAQSQLAGLGYVTSQSATEVVKRLTEAVLHAGLDGVVSSAMEVEAIRRIAGSSFEIVVPGTRLAAGEKHDQARVRSPHEAMQAGASRLVIARAVTTAADKLEALKQFWDDMMMERGKLNG